MRLKKTGLPGPEDPKNQEGQEGEEMTENFVIYEDDHPPFGPHYHLEHSKYNQRELFERLREAFLRTLPEGLRLLEEGAKKIDSTPLHRPKSRRKKAESPPGAEGISPRHREREKILGREELKEVEHIASFKVKSPRDPGKGKTRRRRWKKALLGKTLTGESSPLLTFVNNYVQRIMRFSWRGGIITREGGFRACPGTFFFR